MKQEIKIYLEREDLEKLKSKALSSGYSGKGFLSHYLSKVANSEIAFLDSNVRAILGILNLQPKSK